MKAELCDLDGRKNGQISRI